MKNELSWKEIIFSVILSTAIMYVISIGLLLKFLGFNFLGYANFLVGGLTVYYLCIKYFEGKERVNKCRVCRKPLNKKDKLRICDNCGRMTLREFLKLKLKK